MGTDEEYIRKNWGGEDFLTLERKRRNQLARERTALKRELRLKGMKVDADAPTPVLLRLQRLLALETLLGDIMDGCINPLTACALKVENLQHEAERSFMASNTWVGGQETPQVPLSDVNVLASLVNSALEKFVGYRDQFAALPKLEFGSEAVEPPNSSDAAAECDCDDRDCENCTADDE